MRNRCWRRSGGFWRWGRGGRRASAGGEGVFGLEGVREGGVPSQDNMDGAGRAGLLAGGLGASDRSRASRGTRAIFLSSTIAPKVIDKLSCCS